MSISHRGALAALLLVAGAGCVRHAKVASTPGRTVRAWYQAIQAGHPDAALALCSTQMRDFVGDSSLTRNFERLAPSLTPVTADMQIIEERVDGNYAKVVFAPPGVAPTEGDSMQLIREGDGVWRVALGRP